MAKRTAEIQRNLPAGELDHFYKLDAKRKVRYLERTAFTRKEDPYALMNDAFCHETSCLPVHCTCMAGLAELFPCWCNPSLG